MVHNAYDSFQLLKDCPARIDAVESYGSKLFAGCYDGSLRIYSPPESSTSDPSELHQETYILETTVSGFSKKPIVAMEVLNSRELLLSISESIAFHGLPNLETVAVITKAKGANAYSWDDRRGFLCFSRQKRVCVFKHDGGRGFVEVRDYGVPDYVKSISWCGENICLGIKKEYVILNTANGTLSEVFPSGRVAPPLVISLPSGELILGKENIGVFVDQNGKLLRTEKICWSEAPTAIVIQNPYAIALLPRRVEVRLLRSPYPLIQTIVLQNIRHLVKSNNAVIVGLDNSVYVLFPVSIGAQIVQLTASGNFEEALALCKLLPPEESSLRAAKESSIHTRYAHYLFENGSYEEAMEHFLASQVDITHVLSMYPSIILPKTTIIPQPEKTVDVSGDEASLSRGSSGISDDMESSSPRFILESEDNADLESKKMSHNTLMALIKYLQKRRPAIIEKATSEGTEEVISDAVGKTYGAYDSSKTKKSSKGRGTIPLNSGARELAAILDTALLQALLHTGQSGAALELLKGVNYCDVKICEEILMKSKNYSALLELFKSNLMHHEALKLLTQLAEESKSSQSQTEVTQIFSPELIIEYLKPLCRTDPMLVLEYSMLVLESCPTQTIELFLSGNISADLVNSYLKQHAPSMQGKYLELMMAMNETAVSGNLQNEMVQIYLSEVLDLYAAKSAQRNWDEKDHPPERKKLLSALESISGYSPQPLLKSLPHDALFEERAVILGKMNQHELALSIYVHKLHAPDLALAYCDRIYESVSYLPSGKPSSNIYLTVLQIYLNPKKSAKDFAKRIVALGSFESSDTTKMMDSVLSSKVKGGRSKKIVAIEGAEDMQEASVVSADRTVIGNSEADNDSKESLELSVRNIYQVLSQIPPPEKQAEKSNHEMWSGLDESSSEKPKKKEKKTEEKNSSLLSPTTISKRMKLKFTKAWISFLRLPLPLDVYKEVLASIHQTVIPHLSNPTMLCDFLTKSYDIGGIVSVMALSSLFILMTQHGLEYPNFYEKLYVLLVPSVFVAKHRAKFLQLLDTCMKSSLLPAYLAASFTKKLSRLSLYIPPAGSLVITALIHNLLRRHPTINHLVQETIENTNEANTEADENNESQPKTNKKQKLGIDYFNNQESDPKKSGALKSSLWEIDTLRHHYCPPVSRFVSSLETDLTIRAKTADIKIEDFSSGSYATIFGDEIRRRVKQVPLAFYKAVPTSLFADSDFPGWTFTLPQEEGKC